MGHLEVLRDVLDVALGNTDNHARNTSVLKRSDGTVTLSPLYDFAPMILDRRGIHRVCRWQNDRGQPDWERVSEAMGAHGLNVDETKRWLRGLADQIVALPETMRNCGVPDMVIERCRTRITTVAHSLASIRK